MIIKIIKSLPDEKGIGITPSMLGKNYEVLHIDKSGVWVKEGKLEVLVLYKEFEVVNINEDHSYYQLFNKVG